MTSYKSKTGLQRARPFPTIHPELIAELVAGHRRHPNAAVGFASASSPATTTTALLGRRGDATVAALSAQSGGGGGGSIGGVAVALAALEPEAILLTLAASVNSRSTEGCPSSLAGRVSAAMAAVGLPSVVLGGASADGPAAKATAANSSGTTSPCADEKGAAFTGKEEEGGGDRQQQPRSFLPVFDAEYAPLLGPGRASSMRSALAAVERNANLDGAAGDHGGEGAGGAPPLLIVETGTTSMAGAWAQAGRATVLVSFV